MSWGSTALKEYSKERAVARKARAPRKPKIKRAVSLTPNEIRALKQMARGGY